MRRAVCLTLAVACAVALTACGTMRNTIQPTASLASPVSVALAAGPGAAGPAAGQVGLLAAASDGNMARAGIRLSFQSPASSADALSDVLHGRTDVAVIPEPALMIARSQGDYVLGFATLTQHTSDAIVSETARHIRSVADLRGRTVGYDGAAYEKDLLDAILTRANVPIGSVHLSDVGSDLVGALRSRRVAAAFGDGEAAAVALRTRHRNVRVVPVTSQQIPGYSSLVFVCRETYFANDVNVLRRLSQAAGRGYTAVRADPSDGADVLQAADRSLSDAQAATLVRSALTGAFPGSGEPWGWQDQRDWNTFGEWMTARRLLRGPPAWYDASTNQLLAGQGP